MRNAEQILAIITATFGEDLFRTTTNTDPCLHTATDVEDLACRWRRLKSVAKDIGNNKPDLGEAWIASMSEVRTSYLKSAGD